MPFRSETRVRFAYCDPAGIVFYPRYFELLNGAVEDFFETVAGASFHQLHLREGLATPTAALAADFTAPSRLGDHLVFELAVRKVGRTSLRLAVRVTCGEEARLTGDLTIVQTQLSSGRPVAWSTEIGRNLAQQWIADSR